MSSGKIIPWGEVVVKVGDSVLEGVTHISYTEEDCKPCQCVYKCKSAANCRYNDSIKINLNK